MEKLELIVDRINQVDWSQYSGIDFYEPKDVAKSLIDLALLTDEKHVEKVANNILYTIGNNHAGTYYPAIIDAIDFIIYAALNTEHSVSSRCALAILDDIYGSFCADISNYSGCTSTELEALVNQKIEALLPFLQSIPEQKDLVDLIIERRAP